MAYMYCIFIHSFVNGHLDCFRVLAIDNSATMSIWVHVSFCFLFFHLSMCPFALWFSPDKCPGVGLQDHMVVEVMV